MTVPPPSSRDGLRLALLYAAVFAGIGVAMPFLPLWLAGLGLGPELIGALVALPILVRIVATAPLVGLIDRGVAPRTLMVAGSLGLAATWALMPPAASLSWPLLAGVIVVNAVAGASLVPCLDYQSLAAVRRRPDLDYARIRLGGSLGFLAATLLGGWLLGVVGTGGIPNFLAGLELASACGAALLLRRESATAPARRASGRVRLPAALWLAIAAGAAIQASHAAVYAFGSIHWVGLGLSPAETGIAWGVGVVAEVGFFAVAGRIPFLRDAPFRLLGLGAVAALLRWGGLLAAAGLPTLVLPLQALHALTFGATQLGVMAALSRLAPEGGRGAAQGTYAACAALASASATLASGAAYRAGGGSLAFGLMLPVAGLGLAFTLAAARAARSARQ
ncbi:MFS transporter [Methylobacterium indicum]|uniref:MFS transporter n=1 Tax=Methylobacterium indicum TaxID=1775910 RepID=A0ABR5HEA6_9HYPH|nr:MFS transporter [Methylobacterium indicum]KMO09936.1 MFS transporter [Methylobacterium indicum]KMO24732.1 MFS transporter [Methylobacterium indicum]